MADAVGVLVVWLDKHQGFALVVVTSVYSFFTILLWVATWQQARNTRAIYELSNRPSLVLKANVMDGSRTDHLVVEVLDDVRPSDLAARFAILRHDLPEQFPPDVLHEANLFDPEVRAEDRAGREDLRELPLVTIDGADAKDFDDAVYAEPVRGGGWRLVVAIADVSYYVRYGSKLDLEARSRATSVYFPDRVLAMLPEHLSNHLCSLMPRVERLAFVCDMHVSKAGKLSRGRFYQAVIRSHARLTYDQAWSYLERSSTGQPSAEHLEDTGGNGLARLL